MSEQEAYERRMAANGIDVSTPAPIQKEISTMTDRELLEEIVSNMRTVVGVVEALEDHPMVQAISSGQNPLMAMMGR